MWTGHYIQLWESKHFTINGLSETAITTQAYHMLDELLIAGEISETSKKNVLKAIAAQDMLQEVSLYYTSR